MPQAQMLEDLFDEISIFNKGDHSHGILALFTYEWVNLVDFLYQSCPVSGSFLKPLDQSLMRYKNGEHLRVSL
jgi:hypothetical protein